MADFGAVADGQLSARFRLKLPFLAGLSVAHSVPQKPKHIPQLLGFAHGGGGP